MRFVLAIFRPPCPGLFHIAIAIAFATTYTSVSKATTLPVGPITFSFNSDYDSNFKGTYPLLARSASGYLESWLGDMGAAVYDTSATGGASGLGGTGGDDANNDLSDFTISADVAGPVVNQITAGFLARLDSNEANGYLACAQVIDPTTITFSVYEGSGMWHAGTNVFDATVSISGAPLTANTFYNFAVKVSGGTFSFDFGHGAATASFTDPSVSDMPGQAGFVLGTPRLGSPTAATWLDNFAIASVPEPSAMLLLATGSASILFLAWRRQTRIQ